MTDTFTRPYIDTATGNTVMLTDDQKAADHAGRYRKITPDDRPGPAINQNFPPPVFDQAPKRADWSDTPEGVEYEPGFSTEFDITPRDRKTGGVIGA